MDGHSTHEELPFLEYAYEHRILIICYPSHSTHRLQGLDVVLFGVLKVTFVKARDEYLRTTTHRFGKESFLRIFGPVYKEVFTQIHILKAFEKTGLWPVNPNVVTDDMLAPSQEYSTRPIQNSQSLTVLHMVEVLDNIYEIHDEPRATPRDDNQMSRNSSRSPHSLTSSMDRDQISTRETTPDLPIYSATRFLEGGPRPNVEPFTPRTLRRRVQVNLAQTLIGSSSQLPQLSASPIEPVPVLACDLPDPDWSVARSPHNVRIATVALDDKDKVTYLQNQLLLAEAHSKHQKQELEKGIVAQYCLHSENAELRRQLEEKNNEPARSGRAKKLKGAPRILNTAECIELKKANAAEKQAEEDERRERGNRRRRNQKAKQKRNRIWERIKEENRVAKEQYLRELKLWEQAPQRTRGPKPNKPVRKLKKDIEVSAGSEDDSMDTDDIETTAGHSHAGVADDSIETDEEMETM